MRKWLLVLLPVFFSLSLRAQKEESLGVKIKSPKMNELVDKLWVDLPTFCAVLPPHVIMDDPNGDPDCAAIALKHFRQVINGCKMTDAFKDAIKLEFKLIKLIPVEKVAGTVLDIADLSSKALSASSPEALEADLVKYGFGKVVGDQVVGKLKKLTDVPEGEAGDVLGNLTKLFYKQLWDKAKDAILPKGQKMECQPKTESCSDNISMSIEPYTGDDPQILGKLVFSANGDCNCQLPCAPGQAGNKLGAWSVHGEMLIRVDKAEVVDDGLVFKSKVLQITLRAEGPSYHIQAKCNCGHTSNMHYGGNTFFAGLGLSNEDAGTSQRFNTYGANVAYTHMTSSILGITGDAGVYFGSNNNVNYTKVELLAGMSVVPAKQNGKVILAPHVLAGFADVQAKQSTGNYSSSSNSISFAASIGTDVVARLTEKMGVGLRADYNPTFGKGGVKSNFRAAVGICLRSKKK